MQLLPPSLTFSLRGRRPPEPVPPPAFLRGDALRLATAALWVVVLTLTGFYESVALASQLYEWTDGLLVTSKVVRALHLHWIANLLPALAFSLGWYTFTQRSRRGRPRRPQSSRGRLLQARILGNLVVALCGGTTLHRVWTVWFLCAFDEGFASTAILENLAHENFAYSPRGMEAWLAAYTFCAVAALTLIVIGMESFFLLRELGVDRRPIAVVFTILVAVGLLVPTLGLYGWVGAPLPPVVLAGESWPDGMRSVIRGESLPGDWSDVLTTFDGEGTLRRPRDLRRQPSPYEDPSVCETTVLPIAPILSWLVTLRLSSADAQAPLLERVLEVPASGEEFRLYRRGALVPESHPIEELATWTHPTDWLLVKLDASLAWEEVRQILIHLRDRGVRRISLAVRSIGSWNLPPNENPLLVLDARSSAPLFEVEHRHSGTSVVYVSRWVPPPPEGRPPCEGWDDWNARYSSGNIVSPTTGSLPTAVSVRGKNYPGGYQTLMENIAAAAAAGVREIHVPAAEGR